MALQKSGERVMVESIQFVLAFVFVMAACVELGDAAAVVDVYRIIHYDLGGIPFGSRRAGVNHHAGSMLFAPGTDLSRTVVIMPLRELNLTFLNVKSRWVDAKILCEKATIKSAYCDDESNVHIGRGQMAGNTPPLKLLSLIRTVASFESSSNQALRILASHFL